MVDLLPLALYVEILLQLLDELLLRQSVQILDYTIVVHDVQVTGGECNCHEVIVLLLTGVTGIGLSPLLTHSGSSGRAVVTISNVEGRHLVELSRDGLDVAVVTDDPEGVAEVLRRCDEVVLRLGLTVLIDDRLEVCIVRECEEDRLHIRIQDIDMLHAVILLGFERELMLADDVIEVVVYVSTYHKPVLGAVAHGLSIEVVAGLVVLYQPAFLDKLVSLLTSRGIDLGIVLILTGGEIDLRADDVIEGHRIALGLLASLLGVEDVVGT